MYTKEQLEKMDIPQLMTIASELGVKVSQNDKLENVIYDILDKAAETMAAGDSTAKRKRTRIAKKDTNKVYTVTGSEGESLDAKTTKKRKSTKKPTLDSLFAEQEAAEQEAAEQANAEQQQAEAQAAALRAQMQAREDAINAANSALDQQANAMRDKYSASLSALANDYQNLRDQAEAARYRAMYNQREALANRGALDSGAGRQETLAMNTKYNDNLNAINLQEAAEVADINNAINQMYASVAQQKANNMNSTLNDYAQRLQNTINAIYSGYTPENSAYYQLANNVLQNATSPTIETAQQGTQNNVGAAYAELLRRMGYNV